jgi:hypothetical protein
LLTIWKLFFNLLIYFGIGVFYKLVSQEKTMFVWWGSLIYMGSHFQGTFTAAILVQFALLCLICETKHVEALEKGQRETI